MAPIQRTNISKPACTPPKYDGKTELAIFLQRFDTVCVLNGWADDMVKKLWLSCSLEGEAVRLLDSEYSSYYHLVDALNTQFGAAAKRREYERLIVRRRRQTNEDLHTLASDIKRMVKVVYAEDSSQTRDRMAIRHFSDAINNLQVQWEISRQDFSSFEEVIQYAVERETYFGRDDSGRIRHLESDESSTVRDEIKALQLTVAKLVDTKANSTQKAPLCCKHCGGEHHGYVCDPCHHCGEAHYNHHCPTRKNRPARGYQNQSKNNGSAGKENFQQRPAPDQQSAAKPQGPKTQ